MRIVALKLLELTRFLTPHLSIFSYLFEFCTVLGVRCDVDIYQLTASAQLIYREVYVHTYEIICIFHDVQLHLIWQLPIIIFHNNRTIYNNAIKIYELGNKFPAFLTFLFGTLESYL